MESELDRLMCRRLQWKATGNGEFPFESVIDGEKAFIRVNDFPLEQMYSLIVNSVEIGDFDALPNEWNVPSVDNRTKLRRLTETELIWNEFPKEEQPAQAFFGDRLLTLFMAGDRNEYVLCEGTKLIGRVAEWPKFWQVEKGRQTDEEQDL